MTELINDLKISGFRGFSDFFVPEFGKVNLVTGKNNSGKSSLLEAIRIFAARGSIRTIHSILNYREEMNEGSERRSEDVEKYITSYRSLFTGFPESISKSVEFIIHASGSNASMPSELSWSISWMDSLSDDEGAKIYDRVPDGVVVDTDSVLALVISLGELRRKIYSLDNISRSSIMMSRFRNDWPEIRCIYLDPFSAKTTKLLGSLWDAIALTDVENQVVAALQLISPDIQNITMKGSDEEPARRRTAFVRSKQFSSPVPLRTYGDGVNRLFGIVLALCNARNGLLLIDEFENGLHHSIQASIWDVIFRLAKDLNVQVFATSHSQDCVRAFSEAATSSPQEGVLIRLTRQDGIVLPTIFQEGEMEIAVQNNIEVR